MPVRRCRNALENAGDQDAYVASSNGAGALRWSLGIGGADSGEPCGRRG